MLLVIFRNFLLLFAMRNFSFGQHVRLNRNHDEVEN